MENQKLSVMDVLKENVKILNGLRIPVSEREIWVSVSGVIQNTQLCIDAMERAEEEAKAKSAQKSAGAENVAETNAEERK